jgi:K+-sensing histidine kinase KdpD
MQILNARAWASSTSSAYIYAALGTAIAFFLRYLIHPFLGPNFPTLFFLFNTLFIAFKFGWKPAALSSAVALFLAYYYFIPPYGSFDLESPIDALYIVIYACLFGISIFFIEKLQREKYRAILIARVCESRMRIMAKLSSKSNNRNKLYK